ncbi:MAG: ABC transporter permease [Phycisphaeraceae bacterium]
MKRLHPALYVAALATILVIYLPLLAVAAFSINDAERGFVWYGFTLKWYGQLWHDQRVRQVTVNTLLLAGASTVISTIIGTLLALGMDRFPWPRRVRTMLDGVVYLPVVTPDIIIAASLVAAFALLRTLSSFFDPGLPAMIIGHVTFQVSFVTLVVRSRLAVIGTNLEEAARDLYASTPYLMRRILLPLLLPGILGGAMLALVLSLDDFVISFFTSGPQSTTLPIHIYGELRRGLTARTHALSTIILLATVLLVLALQRLSRRQTDQ